MAQAVQAKLAAAPMRAAPRAPIVPQRPPAPALPQRPKPVLPAAPGRNLPTGPMQAKMRAAPAKASAAPAKASAAPAKASAAPVRAVPPRPPPGLPARQIVQARLSIKNGSKHTLVAAIKKTGILKSSRPPLLPAEIDEMISSRDENEQFGEVDVRNAQQVALLAFRLAERPFKATPTVAPSRERDRRYKLAIVGAGSTAAYYIDTLGPGYDHTNTIVIGGDNPWRQDRGHTIPYINHTARQTAMPSGNVTAYGGNESFVKRKRFAARANRVIAASGAEWIRTNAVTKISMLPDGDYHIEYGEAAPLRAEKVVFSAGSGAARAPGALRAVPRLANHAKIVDMNTFIREIARTAGGKRVVIWGSNAAIDAVAAARKHCCKIVKWLYSKDGKPTWLPGTRYRSDPYWLQTVASYEYDKRDCVLIEDQGPQLRVRYQDDKIRKNEVVAEHVDYLVYGLGTDDLLTGRSAIIDDSVLGGRENLEPLVDQAGLFGNIRADPQHHAFLGWQNPSGTFQVLGLAAENYSPLKPAEPEKEKRRERIAMDDSRVRVLKNWVSGDVAGVGQLTYIRSATRAVNNFVPGSIVERVDYSHADKNQLRIHLATKYPALPEAYAQAFIELLRLVRSGVGDRLPHGFTKQQTDFLDQQLAAKSKQAARGRVLNQGEEVHWKHWMKLQLLAMTPAAGAEVAQGLSKLPRKRR